MSYSVLSREEAAELIEDGQTVAFSGFTPAGAAKAVPAAIAKKANRLHQQNRPFKIRVLSGASTGKLDDLLGEAEAISWRAPYQSSGPLRQLINRDKVNYLDIHLSHMPQMTSYGFFGDIDYAVVEATEVTRDGRVYLTTSIGASPVYMRDAKKVIIEINHYHSARLNEMADIITYPKPPHRNYFIAIQQPTDKVGVPYMAVNPKKIVAVVHNNEPDGIPVLDSPDNISQAIAEHIEKFMLNELKTGRIPPEFLPLQAGVGNMANAVLLSLGKHPDIPHFDMFSEVYQDAMFTLMEQGKLKRASACSLTISNENLQKLYENMDFFAPRIVLRPQGISNNPAVIRRLGVISMNTALEFDVFGHVNSSHTFGRTIVNGIGGSGDFARNAYLAIFMCPSIIKGGRISTVVPMVTHTDHSEHSVEIVVTEQGLADLRGLSPKERAIEIINNCAHPAYRDYLHRYVKEAPAGHTRHNLYTCFELHRNLMETGQMLPELNLDQFV